jgi:hypothetical protein
MNRVLSRDLLGETPPRDPVDGSLGNLGLCVTRRHAKVIARAAGDGDSATRIV